MSKFTQDRQEFVTRLSNIRPLKTGFNTSFVGDRHFQISPGSVS